VTASYTKDPSVLVSDVSAILHTVHPTGGLTMQDQKMENQMSLVENAGPENAGRENAGAKKQNRKMEDQQPEADYG